MCTAVGLNRAVCYPRDFGIKPFRIDIVTKYRDKPVALFHVSAAAPSVVVPSLLLVLQSGIHCLSICAIQLLGQTSFDRL